MQTRSYDVKSSADFDTKHPGAQSFGNADQFKLIKKLVLKALKKAEAESEEDSEKDIGMVSVKRMHAGSKSTVIQLTVAGKEQLPYEKLIKLPGTHEVTEVNTELCGFMLQSAGIQKATWALQTESTNAEPVTLLVTLTKEKTGIAADIIVLEGVKAVPDVNGGFKLVDADA